MKAAAYEKSMDTVRTRNDCPGTLAPKRRVMPSSGWMRTMSAFAPSHARGLHPNAMILRIQPDEGITLRFGAKVPGGAFDVRSVSMDFSYGAAFLEETPEAYERLLLDAMIGDPTLFIRADEVDQAWHIVDPLLQAFADTTFPLARYAAGTWGPAEADRLLQRDGRAWRSP